MISKHVTILKKPDFQSSEDYLALRKEGIDLIEKLASNLWTDYNIHDPGITILELLCFAQTEIGFRLGFNIEDLLAYETNEEVQWQDQCFYTAREILTINPFTDNDWRKTLIDQEGIANAWMTCTPCRCHPKLYADCKESKLTFVETDHPITIRGFWDALLELDIDPQFGDLNGGKIFQPINFANGKYRATAEIRFAPWHQAQYLTNYMKIVTAEEIISMEKTYYHLDVADDKFYKALRDPLRVDVSYKVITSDGEVNINMVELPVRIWFRTSGGREVITKADIEKIFEDTSDAGAFSQYINQLKKADQAVTTATSTLHRYRNLAEDFCKISTVPIVDVGLCADIEMSGDADIEKVLGEAYYLISQYLNPVVKFYTLSELISNGKTSEEIFDGPKLKHGFILEEELAKSELKTTLYTSDIINILMDIAGIESVKNIALTRFDEAGILVESQPWELEIPAGFQPRLYIRASKVLVFKDDLPFLPNQDELYDTLLLWKGIHQQNKVKQEEDKLDLPVPIGSYLDQKKYYPLQYELPENYGVGVHGLKQPATKERMAQARQLKAYLLIFEHLLATYLKQLARFKELLSINPTISKTYFASMFSSQEIKGVTELYQNIDEVKFHDLIENKNQFLDRRNGFLDHLLARFAESFSDYALMLYQAYGSAEKAEEELIFDKINFLKQFPRVSANRAKAINYKDESLVCHPDNKSGLSERIKVVLGLNGAQSFISYQVIKDGNGKWSGYWHLSDFTNQVLMQGNELVDIEQEYDLRNQLKESAEEAIDLLISKTHLEVKPKGAKFHVQLINNDNEIIAISPEEYDQETDANDHHDTVEAFIDQLVIGEKIFVVEHILLRPRKIVSDQDKEQDVLLSVCLDKDCNLCGNEDPYSFRITIVLNGEYGIANNGIAFRKFAEKTIRKETPAHLGVKICWVSENQLLEFESAYCAWLEELAKEESDNILLRQRLITLLKVFKNLKSVYPQATLHDCIDGDDENPVTLDNTII